MRLCEATSETFTTIKKKVNFSVTQCYVPTKNKDEPVKEELLRELQNTTGNMGKCNLKVVTAT